MRLKTFLLIAIVVIVGCTVYPTPTLEPSPLEPATSTMQADDTPISLPPLTADQLGILVGTALTLAFSYIPGLDGWYEKVGRRDGSTDEENDKRNSAFKRMIMGILVVGFGIAIFGLSCTNVLPWVACTRAGAFSVVTVVFHTLISNQGVYQLTKRG